VSGRLWRVDKEATEARDKGGLKIEPEKGTGKTAEREALETRATELGVNFPKNIKDETLRAKVDEAEAALDDLTKDN
jgi:hypothetical protein